MYAARLRMPLLWGALVPLVAECGNSGDSTEPQLHFRLMDHHSVLFAATN